MHPPPQAPRRAESAKIAKIVFGRRLPKIGWRAIGWLALVGGVGWFLLAGWQLVADPTWRTSHAEGHRLPSFRNQDPQAWINSAPLSEEALQGEVVMIEVWSYG